MQYPFNAILTRTARDRKLRLQILAVLALAIFGCDQRVENSDEAATNVGDDYIAVGRSIVLSDRVAGDAILAAGEIKFGGYAVGDLLAVSGNLAVNGPIGGSLRAAGGKVTIEERIARNATAIGGEINLGTRGGVDGNAYLSGGRIIVRGTVVGSLHAGGGEVTLDGPIGGDVRVEAERLTLGPASRIQGSLTYRVPPANVHVDSAAQISGVTIILPQRPPAPFPGILRVLLGIAFLVAGTVAVAVFPATASAAAQRLRQRTAASIGTGVLLLFAVPVAIVVMLATVVGIPLGFITAVSFGIILYLSGSIAAVLVGGQLLRRNAGGRREKVIAHFLLGAVVLVLLGMVPVLGIMIRVLSVVAGLGALALAVRRDSAGPKPPDRVPVRPQPVETPLPAEALVP
jgi:cytoskeletal protein CcmA (bactofilin family)